MDNAKITTNLEKSVKPYLSVRRFKEKWEHDKTVGAGYFYSLTYQPISDFFESHPSLYDQLEIKVALIYSWNPTICKVTPESFNSAIENLKKVSKTLTIERTTNILDINSDEMIHQLWHPIKMATSSRDHTPGVSVTKFLHFSFPNIFPMIDLNMMQGLGGKNVNPKWYTRFLHSWENLYREYQADFDSIALATDMPIARVIDVMLFTPR